MEEKEPAGEKLSPQPSATNAMNSNAVSETPKEAGGEKTQNKVDDLAQLKDEEFVKDAECCIIL
jgi:hypothetical protein